MTLLSTASCVGRAPPAIASSCSWESVFYPTPGFETRWDHAEKSWLVEHNRNVKQFCPAP